MAFGSIFFIESGANLNLTSAVRQISSLQVAPKHHEKDTSVLRILAGVQAGAQTRPITHNTGHNLLFVCTGDGGLYTC